METASAEDLALIERYLQHVRVEKRLAARTQDLYAEHLHGLANLCAKDGTPLTRVRDGQVRRWAAKLHSAGRNPRGIALVLSCWRGMYRWLGRQGLVEMNPVQGVRAPKAAKPLPKALGVEDAVRLAEFHDESAHPALAARDDCLAELLYGCGLRLGELQGLDAQASASAKGWVDLESGEVHVLGKGSKRRSVPVGEAALQALRRWLEWRAVWGGGDPALFIGRGGQRLTPQYLRQRLKDRALRAGLTTSVHPHVLRHSFASHVLQSSSDLRGVQELLGHASIGTTQVYTRLDFQHLASVYESAHPRAKGVKSPRK